MQVLSTVPVMFSYWAKPADALDLSRRLNDHIAEVVQGYPARFSGLGTIPLQDPDLAAEELRRCVEELGLRGVEIGTHVDANTHLGRAPTNLDDRDARPGLERRGTDRCRHLCPSVGHGGKGANAEILAAVARRNAGRNFARDLLDDVRRSLRSLSEAPRSFCPWRRGFPFHCRPGGAWLCGAARTFARSTVRLTAEVISPTGASRRAFMSTLWSTTPKPCASCSSSSERNASRSALIIPFR